MVATADRTDIDSFGIALPASWEQIPLEREPFEAFVNARRRKLAADEGVTPTMSRQFELLARQMRADCVRTNVTFAASVLAHIDPTDADLRADEDAESGLLAAVCTLASASRAELGGRLPLTVNTLAAAMSRSRSSDDGAEIVNLDPPAIVDMPVGPVVKLVRLHRHYATAARERRASVFVQQYLVPYAAGERAAIVSFSSITPQYARPLHDLFESMMRSFGMFGGDDPTDPTAPGGDR